MTSLSQIETNRRHAGSTGLKTEEGKRQSEGELMRRLASLLWRLRGNARPEAVASRCAHPTKRPRQESRGRLVQGCA
jgi:hypothetical protein